jgi:hypothetical protein
MAGLNSVVSVPKKEAFSFSFPAARRKLLSSETRLPIQVNKTRKLFGVFSFRFSILSASQLYIFDFKFFILIRKGKIVNI